MTPPRRPTDPRLVRVVDIVEEGWDSPTYQMGGGKHFLSVPEWGNLLRLIKSWNAVPDRPWTDSVPPCGGWHEITTGGGCMACEHDLPGGQRMLAVDAQSADIPERMDTDVCLTVEDDSGASTTCWLAPQPGVPKASAYSAQKEG